VRIRILEEGDFASDFHIFGLQRLPNSIRFYVDGIPIGQVDPPPGGFWDIGNFDKNPGGPNIWANGTSMTPFDYPVSPDPSVSSHCSLSQPRNPAGSSKRSFLSPGILDFSFSFGIFPFPLGFFLFLWDFFERCGGGNVLNGESVDRGQAIQLGHALITKR